MDLEVLLYYSYSSQENIIWAKIIAIVWVTGESSDGPLVDKISDFYQARIELERLRGLVFNGFS